MVINWNPLERCIRRLGLDPVKTMNALQLAGIVSDNAVIAHDVGRCDCDRAVERLEARHLAFVVGAHGGTN